MREGRAKGWRGGGGGKVKQAARKGASRVKASGEGRARQGLARRMGRKGKARCKERRGEEEGATRGVGW